MGLVRQPLSAGKCLSPSSPTPFLMLHAEAHAMYQVVLEITDGDLGGDEAAIECASLIGLSNMYRQGELMPTVTIRNYEHMRQRQGGPI